ncbi:hypothetical protein [Streptomyces sp. NPDC060205]|uniref:hypothetical protein n=1 Tax=Streptomyces sp. NPDC060205 TaxID=3347072 RepID=UPI0036461D40
MVWDVIAMDNPLIGTSVRTRPYSAPRRVCLLNKISELDTENGRLQQAVVSHAVIVRAIGVIVALGNLRPDQSFKYCKRSHSTPASNWGESPNAS